MRKKFLFVCLLGGLAVVGYLVYRTVLFSKNNNKVQVSKSIPDVTLESIFNNKKIKVKYLLTLTYEKKYMGFNAILNDKYYVTVIKLGKIENSHLILNKSNTDFKNNNELLSFPIDFDYQVTRYVGFDYYPFHIKNMDYYIGGKEITKLEDSFTEIIFKGDFINFSFNNQKRGDFGYVTPNEEMSVSFVLYNNELYAINTKKYKNYPFKSLHSLLSENSQE
ncbi:hypothetical protein [Chryseobacterium sp. G0201]|uniref:hypothetical protein n=1 Tax=Chryseobacterium sp. G0201 TaxID=2487065 RepID=UPI000F4D6E81|nr:hypothetical protein [Chryseobacterium sp. G0201]AZA51546.1 hypothetical protein EG348_00270 [Chryseobacterium sp. G0201]